FCTTTYASVCTFGDYIARVVLGTLNNASTCATPPYTFFNSATVPNMVQGSSNNLVITLGPDTFGQHAGAWIDFNQDGDFTDPGECLGVTGNLGANGTGTITFTVPANAALGVTRMRVRGGNDSPLTCAQSCGTSSSGFGETEDYNVNITPCIQITSMSAPANRTVQCSSTTTFTTNLGAASIPNIGWEYKVTPAGLWNNVIDGVGPGGVVFSGATTNTLTLSGIPSTISGYQFRAYASNPCTALDVTPAATLTVVPLVATVTPSAVTICQGTVQELRLTNATSPTTTTFNATTGLPANVPDNNTTGITRTLNVAGIPANAVITEIRMTFNMTHTWVGDMVMNLQAPNGATINLFALLDNLNGGNGTDNFVNTAVTSDGSRPTMDGAPAPRTGVFRANLYNANVPSLLPTTTNSWATMLNPANVNGVWTLGMCDLGPADLGVLQSWSITITYGAPAAGVWTGPAGTMWLNGGATIPYAGTSETSIYVNPSVSSNYSVVYTTANPTCVSTPTVIPVTVLNPLGTVVQPANKSVCVGGNTTFNVTAPGGPFTYQWQESRDMGLTWNNVSNGGVYSGATTNTLSLTGVTRSAPVDMNNFMYRCAVSTAPCPGSFTSNAATLTVWALPSVTISATDLALLPNQTSTITGSSNPAPGASPNWAWTRDGAPIAGATTSSVVANIDRLGVYQATVTDINGCRNSSNNLLIEAEEGDKLWIYPNPTSGQFQIRLYYPQVITEKRRIQIFDSKGAEVMSRDIMLSVQGSPHYQRFDVDLTNQPAGVYLVRVIDMYTKKAKSGFVVKQSVK
ncbi:MAG: GEVED domain-containing protein, partial [Chitinophagaceae bacterium]